VATPHKNPCGNEMDIAGIVDADLPSTFCGQGRRSRPSRVSCGTTVRVVTVIAVPFFVGDRIDELRVAGEPTILAPQLPDGTPQERMAVLYRHLAERVADSSRVVVVAGDCLAPIGVLAGLQHRLVEAKLIWFDAHGDFHTWETTQSGFLGGMPLAMLVGRGEQTVVNGAGLQPLPASRVILVGARDLDPGEEEALVTSGVTLVSVDALAHTMPPAGPLYVHVDVDVVDPADMPAVNYPAPEGPSLAQVRAALLHLGSTDRVVAFSLSSWNPDLPGADVAARAAGRLIELFTA